MSLSGHVTVLTGASSGIGRSIALAVGAQRAHVCLLGRRPEKLEEVAAAVKATGGSASIYRVDLASDEQLIAATNAIILDTGRVDVLIHCAGIVTLGPVSQISVDELDHLYRVNLRAPYLLTQRLLPFIQARTGQIVFVNSSAGTAAKANNCQYAATKHALKALADGLRQELTPSGIRVVTVYPARTATPMQETVFRFENRVYRPELLLQPEHVAGSVLHVLTLPRDAEITDLAIRGVANMSVD